MPELRIGIQLANLRLPFKKALQTAAQLGAQGVELDARAAIRPEELSQTGARQIRKMLDDLDLRVCAIRFRTRRGYNEAENLEARIAATKQAMQMAFRLGAPNVINHVGRLPELSEDMDWGLLPDTLSDLGKYGQHVGATLTADTGPDDPEALARLIEALPMASLAVNLNPGNLIVHGFSPLEALERLGAHVQHVQANDGVRDLAQGRGLKTPLGRGSADFPEMVGGLERRRYNGFFTVDREESADPVNEIGHAVSFLKSITQM